MTIILKGITARIFRDGPADYSNGGISSRVQEVTVAGPKIDGPFEPSEDAPAVRLVTRIIGRKVVIHAEPMDRPTDADNRIGPMFGGTYIASCDSRFSEATGMYGAIPLHDRWETAEEYRTLST